MLPLKFLSFSVLRIGVGASARPVLVRGLRRTLSYDFRTRPPAAGRARVSFRFGHLVEARISVKPTVLVVTTVRWFPTARLAVALANAGFTVDAVCPSHHPITRTDAVRRIYNYDGLDALSSVAEAIAGAKPDVLVPGDDLATQHLHLLYDQERRKGDAGAVLCELIERSLGSPENFPTLYARTKFMELARDEGIRVPQTSVIHDTAELKQWIAQAGLPTV